MECSLGGEIRPAGKLTRALCSVSALIDSSIDGEVLLKRFQFLLYELQQCSSEMEPAQDRLTQLINFFFHTKGYGPSSIEPHGGKDSAHLVSTLFSSGRARVDVVTALFCVLGQELGLPIQVLAVQPLRYVKLQGFPGVMDLAQKGRALSPQELIEVLEHNMSLKSPAEAPYLDTTELLTKYLIGLRDCALCPEEPEIQLALQSQLIELCPHQMSLYGERARILYKMGQKNSALKDLKRYFSFADLETGHPELAQLMLQLEQDLHFNRDVHHFSL